jgi:peptidoglycan/xylan/chitin deacetylase (PgdA/CDA1 family)
MDKKALILMYHRVAILDSDPWGLSVSPQHFEEQLEVLKNFASCLTVGMLAKNVKQKELDRKSIAITFDDGYADNFQTARPLLEKHDLLATIFIVTGAIGSDREFWWDELDRLFLQEGSLPQTFHWNTLPEVEWNLSDVSDYSKEEAFDNRSWKTHQDPPTERHALYYFLWQQLRGLTTEERQSALREFRIWAKKDDEARPTHRPMSLEELQLLATSAVIELGCHTVTHPRLSTLGLKEQHHEIASSKKMLEEWIGRQVSSFAYPYGSQDDFTDETTMVVKATGLKSACTTLLGTASETTDLLLLPRVAVEDWNGEEFTKVLKKWFDEN